ncbi:MAG: DUF1287 domain-containing protein [Pyrinomonadaceae bacterium]
MPLLKNSARFLLIASLFVLISCQSNVSSLSEGKAPADVSDTFAKPKLSEVKSPEIRKILESANKQTETTTSYTQKYYTIDYPNGDVPKETGACTDVIIRAFRAAGVDLQKEVHEDMRANFSKYPQKWGLSGPDTNIDHRRVPNLQTFFERRGKDLPVSDNGETYEPGDVVTWDLDGKGMTHTGLVSNIWSDESKRYLIIHNIGRGARLEDRLFDWKVTGHYRYF